MSPLALTRSALVALTAAALAGCGADLGASPQSMTRSESAHASERQPSSFNQLYSFSGPPGDAANPEGGLLAFNGALYGTSQHGGSSDNGVVYEISTSGTERVLYNFGFGGAGDGGVPLATPIAFKGALYGTTFEGGQNDLGTVFEMSTSGKERVLYSFAGGADGEYPYSGLIEFKGAFYGTTYNGGQSGLGTVFVVSASGKERVLYSFAGGADGAKPYAGLFEFKGALYGTTSEGGGGGCTYGCGTVYKVGTSGGEHVLYSFAGGADGANPFAGLMAFKGVLYGTTVSGGASNDGTVFQISTSGSEHVLYSFAGGDDGDGPFGGLTVLKGALYGTTFWGGGCGSVGCGTVFEVTTSGHERILYRFTGGVDGSSPYAGLSAVKGALYGTTFTGGTSFCGSFGCGSVFKVTP